MMALRVLALVVLTGLVIGDELPVEDWGVEGAEFRLLLESSAESGERSAVELASLGAAIGLTNVVDVVDLTDGESVAWALTSDRGWLTFEEGDGGELGVYLSTNASLGALSSGSLVVSGKLERVTTRPVHNHRSNSSLGVSAGGS